MLLLSPEVKQDSKSPSSKISTVQSRSSWRPGCRFTLTTRTRDLPYLFSASVINRSASSIRGVTVWTQEQRNVKVRFAGPNLKVYFDHRIESFDSLGGVIASGIKQQTV